MTRVYYNDHIREYNIVSGSKDEFDAFCGVYNVWLEDFNVSMELMDVRLWKGL